MQAMTESVLFTWRTGYLRLLGKRGDEISSEVGGKEL